MSRREDIVLEARRWIGTPYVHQASCLGAGTDCLGLIRGVWRTIVGKEPEGVPVYTPDWSEPNREETLLSAAFRWLHPKPLTSDDVGDILVFRMIGGNVAKHLGVASLTERGVSFIHAYSGHCVAETSLSTPWMRRIVGRFEFPTGEK